MILRRAYRRGKLKTRAHTAKIFGGEDLCAFALGYAVGGKTLTAGRKFVPLYTSAEAAKITSIDFFPNVGLALATSSDKKVFGWYPDDADFSFVQLADLHGDVPPSTFEYHGETGNYAALVSGRDIVQVYGERLQVGTLPYSIKGACMHMGRMFAVDAGDKFTVRWSSYKDVYDWTQSALGGGYIRLNPERGALYRVIPLGERLIVYREFGIDVIKAFGDPRHFAVVPCGGGSVTERLNEDACAVCGNDIYFCSDKTIYRYSNGAISALTLPDYMGAENFSRGKAYESRYVNFYCKTLLYGNEYQIELDVVDKTVCFYAYGKKTVWKTPQKFYAISGDTVYVQSDGDGEDMTSVWMSRKLDFGDDKLKYLRCLRAVADGDISISVTASGITRGFAGGSYIRTGICGDDFVFEVNGNGRLSSLEAEWEARE